MRNIVIIYFLLITNFGLAQDTTFIIDKQKLTLPDVIVRNNFDYKRLLQQIKEDTTFYKAFRNLRVIGFTSYNDIKMLDKNGYIDAYMTIC